MTTQTGYEILDWPEALCVVLARHFGLSNTEAENIATKALSEEYEVDGMGLDRWLPYEKAVTMINKIAA